MDLPTIFTSPYAADIAPVDCCCGGSAPMVAVAYNAMPVLDENGQIITRMDQASRIIAAANVRGFPVFQGS